MCTSLPVPLLSQDGYMDQKKFTRNRQRGNLDYFMLTIEYNTMDRTQDHGTSVEEDVKEEVFFLNLLSSLLSKKH